MSTFSDYTEDAVLDHLFRNTALTSPTTVNLALYSEAPTDAVGGTELVVANGYAREAITFGAASGGSIANTAPVSFLASGAAWLDVVAIGIFDATTNLLAWDVITTASIGDGDTLTFPIGDITITLD